MAEQGHNDACCRRCGYLLRQLVGQRCPECGQAFSFAEPDTFDRSTRSRRVRLRGRRLRLVGWITISFLVAIGVGICGLRYRWHAEQACARELRQIGGTVKFERVGPKALRDNLPAAMAWTLERVTFVELCGTRASDAEMRRVGRLGALRALYLVGTAVTTDGVAHIRALPHLKMLCLAGKEIGDDALLYLGELHELECLRLGGTAITDSGLVYVRRLRGLRELLLHETEVADAGMALLAELTSLRKLSLDGTRVSDAGLREVGHMGKLIELSLNGLALTDEGVERLGGLQELSVLYLSNTRITGRCFRTLARLPALRELYLSDVRLDQEFLKHLQLSQSLRVLWLDHTDMADHTLLDIPDVEFLVLTDNPRITDAGIQRLSGRKQLRYLNVAGTAVTAAGVDNLERSLPTVRVER